MSTSPKPAADPIVRGTRAQGATAARFEVDFRRSTDIPVPAELLEQARASALAAGYAEGWAQGQREAKVAAQAAEAQAQAAEQELAQGRAATLQRAVGAVLTAADQLNQRSVPVIAELEDLVLRSAVELAEALLGRALADSPERGLDALRRALALAPAAGTLTVRLHPEDVDALGAPGGDYLLGGRSVTLVPDVSLAPGDAVAELGTTTIDARLADAVRRVRAVLDER
jgi:flagellar assembly protein FliH